ncbi:hypothetical protein, partial [Pseudomonas oleovorans]|uniref:hypothetical protein n=1 Tax=Ectopseudomonas oleovorans TaxID=301 RepID=UPI0028E23EAF
RSGAPPRIESAPQRQSFAPGRDFDMDAAQEPRLATNQARRKAKTFAPKRLRKTTREVLSEMRRVAPALPRDQRF